MSDINAIIQQLTSLRGEVERRGRGITCTSQERRFADACFAHLPTLLERLATVEATLVAKEVDPVNYDAPLPPRMTVGRLVGLLQQLPPEHTVVVMDKPDSGDLALCITSVTEWDCMAVLDIDTTLDNGSYGSDPPPENEKVFRASEPDEDEEP